MKNPRGKFGHQSQEENKASGVAEVGDQARTMEAPPASTERIPQPGQQYK